MRITQVADMTSTTELNGIRAIVFGFTTTEGVSKTVAIDGQWGMSYAQYEASALKALLQAGLEALPGWTWVATR